MLFNSFEFILVFLPVVMIGFFLIARFASHTFAISWLAAASFVFYGWWNWNLMFLLAGSVIVNYVCGLWLAKRRSKALLTATIVFNLGLLGWFKYVNFFIDNINALAGSSISVGAVVLPIGISFFTFQQIAYLVDVYRGLAREPGFHRYCLFVTFFPQLIAGPIVHHSEMLPQFSRRMGKGFNYDHFSAGITIFAIGLIKKLAIADPLGVQADRIFEMASFGDPITFITAWYGTMAFGLQIYFDFSGYSDMAIGLARLFGIRLPLNFDSPYKAGNIIDFWRRWHITLTRFLRDYLYFPLGGNRKGPVRRYINLTAVMLLGGLWHGASWNFIVWGGIHGIFLMINHGWRALRRAAGMTPTGSSLWGSIVSRIIMLAGVFFAWSIFRAEDWQSAIVMINGLLGQSGFFLPDSYAVRLGQLAPLLESLGVQFAVGPDPSVYPTRSDLGQLLAIMLIVLFAPSTQEWMERSGPTLDIQPQQAPGFFARMQWRPNAFTGATVAVACISGLVLLLQQASNAFIYFQF